MKPLKRFLEEFLLMLFTLWLFPLVAGSPLAFLIFTTSYAAITELKKILLGEAEFQGWNWNTLKEPLWLIGGIYLCLSGLLFAAPSLLPLVFFTESLMQLLSLSLFYSLISLFFSATFPLKKSDRLEENRGTTLSSQPFSEALYTFIAILIGIVFGAFKLAALKPIASVIVGCGLVIALKECLEKASNIISSILTRDGAEFEKDSAGSPSPDDPRRSRPVTPARDLGFSSPPTCSTPIPGRAGQLLTPQASPISSPRKPCG